MEDPQSIVGVVRDRDDRTKLPQRGLDRCKDMTRIGRICGQKIDEVAYSKGFYREYNGG